MLNDILRKLFVLPLLITTAVLTGPVLADDEETESGDGKSAADAPVGASAEGRDAMSTFRKPAGWEVSLFAAEPELANPVAMYVDHQGRVYVCESFRQDRGVTDNRKHDREWLLADLSAESVQDRIDYHNRLLGTEAQEYTAHDDRIRVLEDSDGDGVADKTSMFASGFNKLEDGTGAGVLARGNDVYFTCIPKLWLLTDSDGDQVSDSRKALHDGYGVRVAFRGHDSHGLIIGPDGRLYFSIGDRGYNIETEAGKFKNVESGAVFRCELDGSRLEVFATGLRNPQELAFDDYGYLFTGDNNSDSGDKARWVNVMQGGDTGWRMMYQYLPDRGPFNREKIWHPYSEETPAYIVPCIENISDGPSGLTCYPGTGLIGDYANTFFLADFRGGPSNSGIRLIRAQPKGAFWEIERSEQPIWSILATDVDFGPDGAIWICDWVDGWVGEGKGRVYRFFDPEAQKQPIVREVQQQLKDGFTKLSLGQLAELLKHEDRRLRLEAQWELASRGDTEQFAALLSDKEAGTIARLHALWGMGHAARIKPQLATKVTPLIESAMADVDLDVRRVAVAVAGDLKLKSLSKSVAELISDSEPRVAFAACMASHELGLDTVEPVSKLLSENGNQDPGLRHAGIMALKGAGSDAVAKLSIHSSPAVRLAAVVALRKLEDKSIAAFLSDSDAAVQLETARAIHDVVELHELLPQLAALVIDADSDPALVHRVLNANFRLGGEGANRVAAYASLDGANEDMRIEAANMLADWAQPGELCRVMNRYLPIADRDVAPAREAISASLTGLLSGSQKLTLAVIEAVKAADLKSASAKMKDIAESIQYEGDIRGMALEAFGRLAPESAADLIIQMVNDPELDVRTRALMLLAKTAPERATEELTQAVQSEFARERQMAWDTASTIESDKSTELIAAGIERYIDGKLPGDVWLNVLEAADGRLSDELQAKLDAFQASKVQQDALMSYRDCLEGGDVESGKTIFTTKTELSCVRCHKIGGEGGEVGPNLSKIAAKNDHRYLLEAIVEPNAKIAKNFETVILLLEEGDVVSGVVKTESDTLIEVMDAEGKIIAVDPDEVVGRKTGKSSMPADLVKMMSRRELRDLIAYLASLK
ncbi:MAG: c-type cytochrome [Aureliella sp.]